MSTHCPSDQDIQQFWDWFSSIADDGIVSDESLQGDLDHRVSSLGSIVWELGPGASKRYSLAISPDGDPALLPLTTRIVSMAPSLAQWEFHRARQTRVPCMEFSIDAGGHMIDVDARTWRYILRRAPNNQFDIVIEQGNLSGADPETRYSAAVILLDGILGEARRLVQLRDVDAVVDLAEIGGNTPGKVSDIGVLADHLDTLLV